MVVLRFGVAAGSPPFGGNWEGNNFGGESRSTGVGSQTRGAGSQIRGTCRSQVRGAESQIRGVGSQIRSAGSQIRVSSELAYPGDSGVFRGWTWSDVHPLPGDDSYFQQVIIYIAKNNELVGNLLHASRVQMKVRYFIHYSHRDLELDYESDVDEFGPKNRRESL